MLILKMQSILSHHIRIFFYRMTRFWKISRFTVNFVFSRIQLQPSRWVVAFVVVDVVLLCVHNTCEISWINGKVHLSLCPKWSWFSSEDVSTLSQCSILCAGKDTFQKLKEHLHEFPFPCWKEDTEQGFPNSVKGWGESDILLRENFLIGWWEPEEEWLWPFETFSKLKKLSVNIEHPVKSKLAWPCLYSEYEVKNDIEAVTNCNHATVPIEN